MKKLVLFGDSLFGQFGKHRMLALEKSLPDYDVYNCAAGGWNTTDCVKKAPYISTLRPDLVAISLGTNDMSPWKQVDLKLFRENLEKIINIFKQSEIIYFLPPPVDESKEESDRKILNKEAQAYIDAIKELCSRHNIKLVDSWNIFMPMLEQGKEYHVEDGVHLNDLAYETFVKELSALVIQK